MAAELVPLDMLPPHALNSCEMLLWQEILPVDWDVFKANDRVQPMKVNIAMKLQYG